MLKNENRDRTEIMMLELQVTRLLRSAVIGSSCLLTTHSTTQVTTVLKKMFYDQSLKLQPSKYPYKSHDCN